MADKPDDIRMAEREVLNAFNAIRKLRGEPPLTAFPKPPYCSFCGKSKEEVGVLVGGASAHICSDCVAEAQQVIRNA
jgi:ClpX C4-type zinc finger protein